MLFCVSDFFFYVCFTVILYVSIFQICYFLIHSSLGDCSVVGLDPAVCNPISQRKEESLGEMRSADQGQ